MTIDLLLQERDHYKALCEELRERLESLTNGMEAHLQRINCDSCKENMDRAKTTLTKIKD